MYVGKTLFAQVMDFLPWSTFARLVGRYAGDHRTRRFSCAEQFRAMAFAQLTYRESLRDIEACLSAQSAKRYHLGFRSTVARSTLADANENRDWRLYAEFAQRLIVQARRLYAKEHLAVELSHTVCALDSTTIDLCLSMFPWARYRGGTGAVKVHTLLDLRGAIPSFVRVSRGNVNDVNALDWFEPEAGAFFVTRAKKNLDAQRLASSPSDRNAGVICDQRVALRGELSQHRYPEPLRRIRFNDPAAGKRLVFLTNQMTLPALTVCALYKSRWQIELFFKWVKQHLRIKRFYGTSENAVKTQIWIAVTIYVLVAIIKKRLNLEPSLHTLLQILSVSIFEKMPLAEALSNSDYPFGEGEACNQMNLFDS